MDSSRHIYLDNVRPILVDFCRELKRKRDRITLCDIGCGDGTKIHYLTEMGLIGPDDSIIGLDVNPERVRRIRESFPWVDARLGDAATLEGVPDASCDGLIATAVVEHLPDPEALMRSARRVLKPGGMIYITSLVRKRFIIWYYRNMHGEFARDPEHHYEWRSDEEFQSAMSKFLKPKLYHPSRFYFQPGCIPLLMRRMKLLDDNRAEKWTRALDRNISFLRVADPFFHRAEMILEKTA